MQFVDFENDVQPQLIMEYLPLGSLDRQHYICSITHEETIVLLFQCLEALEYLHATKGISHRDLKPGNILVQSRNPLHVKLCDFGLAKNIGNTSLRTLCGTHEYRAPEIYLSGSYTPAVDL